MDDVSTNRDWKRFHWPNTKEGKNPKRNHPFLHFSLYSLDAINWSSLKFGTPFVSQFQRRWERKREFRSEQNRFFFLVAELQRLITGFLIATDKENCKMLAWVWDVESSGIKSCFSESGVMLRKSGIHVRSFFVFLYLEIMREAFFPISSSNFRVWILWARLKRHFHNGRTVNEKYTCPCEIKIWMSLHNERTLFWCG